MSTPQISGFGSLASAGEVAVYTAPISQEMPARLLRAQGNAAGTGKPPSAGRAGTTNARSSMSDHTSAAGDCPRCNSFDDDLSHRGGLCETCFREDQCLSEGLKK